MGLEGNHLGCLRIQLWAGLPQDVLVVRLGLLSIAFALFGPSEAALPQYLLRVAGSARGGGTAENGQGYMQNVYRVASRHLGSR